MLITLLENPRLLSLGMNGTRSEAKASHLYGMRPRTLGRGVFIEILETRFCIEKAKRFSGATAVPESSSKIFGHEKEERTSKGNLHLGRFRI
jgi:hypothetical protein